MTRIIRSAMLSMRISPEIRLASENVLQRLGLNITEAMEMFLRRMVIEQRIPFEVAAIDPTTYARLLLDWEEAAKAVARKRNRRGLKGSESRMRTKRE